MAQTPLEQIEKGIKKWLSDYQNLVQEIKDYDKKANRTTLAQDLDFLVEEIGRINGWIDWLGEAAALIDAYVPQNQSEAERKTEIVTNIAAAGLTMLNSRRRLRILESTLNLRASGYRIS